MAPIKGDIYTTQGPELKRSNVQAFSHIYDKKASPGQRVFAEGTPQGKHLYLYNRQKIRRSLQRIGVPS